MTDAHQTLARPQPDVAPALAVEHVGPDHFTSKSPVGQPESGRLYGGQIAANALMAAGLTVAEERHPHSLHGYFLRAGHCELPVELQVYRDRDGRSFSARKVDAVQRGEVIFSMLTSFHIDEPSGTVEPDWPSDARPAEQIPEPREIWGMELREVTPMVLEGKQRRASDQMWIRLRERLPEDRLSLAAAVTYVSDMGNGFGQADVPGLGTGGPSIDHAMWFQEPIRCDEWVLLHVRPLKAWGSRGVYEGTVRSEEGRLGAVLVQESLLRPSSRHRRR